MSGLFRRQEQHKEYCICGGVWDIQLVHVVCWFKWNPFTSIDIFQFVHGISTTRFSSVIPRWWIVLVVRYWLFSDFFWVLLDRRTIAEIKYVAVTRVRLSRERVSHLTKECHFYSITRNLCMFAYLKIYTFIITPPKCLCTLSELGRI